MTKFLQVLRLCYEGGVGPRPQERDKVSSISNTPVENQAMVAVPAFLAQVGIRTHLSKLLDQDEVGKVFSFLATCDAVLPIAGELMYTAIFNWSISFLPGMPYLFTACITLISVGLLSYCTKVTRDNIAYEEMSKADESVVSVGSTAVNS